MSTGLGIFGDVRTAELTPVAGWTFVYNVNSDLVNTSLTGSGSVSQENAMAVLSTGAAATSSARIETRRYLRYIPGIGGLLRFTSVFNTPVPGNNQYIGLGTTENALYLGWKGTDFIVARMSGGVVEDEKTSSKMLFPFPSLDFTNGQVFQIRYQWLGFGRIEFQFEAAVDGLFKPLHIIRYPNTAAVPSLLNPTMPVFAMVENTTNDTDVKLRTPSAMAMREGFPGDAVDPLILPRTFNASATGITTEAAVLAVRSKTTYQSHTNLIEAIPSAVSLSCEGTKPVTMRVYRGGTVSGGTWVDFNTSTSSLQANGTPTGFSGGTLLFAYQLAKEDSLTDKIRDWGVVLEPGEELMITAQSTVSTDVNAAVLLKEPF